MISKTFKLLILAIVSIIITVVMAGVFDMLLYSFLSSDNPIAVILSLVFKIAFLIWCFFLLKKHIVKSESPSLVNTQSSTPLGQPAVIQPVQKQNIPFVIFTIFAWAVVLVGPQVVGEDMALVSYFVNIPLSIFFSIFGTTMANRLTNNEPDRLATIIGLTLMCSIWLIIVIMSTGIEHKFLSFL